MENNDKNITKEEFNKALVEVRKSFRLLYEFQYQVLKLINHIGTSFKMRPYKWYPKLSTLITGQEKLDSTLTRWTLDWFHIYYSEFVYNKDNLYLRILLALDTGWFEYNFDNWKTDVEEYIKNSEPDLTDEDYFVKPAADSHTLLILILERKNSNDADFKNDKLLHKDFFNKNKTSGKIGTAFYAVYPLEEFYSLEATDNLLKQFAKEAKKQGYDLKIKEE